MLKSMGNRTTAFRKESDGQISIIMALALIPILTIAGLAIDFQRTSTYKSRVQYAMDAALIAGSRAKQEGKTNEEISTLITEYMNAVLEVGEGDNTTTYCQDAVVDVPPNSEDINATIDCSYPTTLSMAIGRTQMEFTVSSTSTYGIGNLDVAFVFDVSGSMGGTRIRDLRDAAKQAIDTLLPDGHDQDNGVTRIAMTSYATMVDAGPYFEAVTGVPADREYTATWEEIDKMKMNQCKKLHSKSYCKQFKSGKWVYLPVEHESTYSMNDTCVYERDGAHAFNDAPPGANESYTFWTGASVDDEGSEVSSEQITGVDNSYLTERHPTWDEDDQEWDTPSSCSDHPPLPLTDNKVALKQYVDDLDPGGGTAGHQGTMWGWYLISPHWGDIWVNQVGESARPFDYDEPDTAKALIMMTDGSFNRWHHDELGNSSQQAIATCATAKANGIVIYTVAFQAPSDAQATLEACASGPEYAHTPENNNELEDAYQAIATSISDLRIKF